MLALICTAIAAGINVTAGIFIIRGYRSGEFGHEEES